ncbi:hypothetical protein [Proteus columbae]|uniref:hypothetical protein n=1 Tax=Proteus columbae TaxID=1987580 RepID=UPI00288BA6F9|nr:hypothetical protein [Proteus columbae]
MYIKNILRTNNIEDLKLLAPFNELVKIIENELDAKVIATDWISLYKTIISINEFILWLNSDNSSNYKKSSFLDTKKYLSEKLGVSIKAHSWKKLDFKIDKLKKLLVLSDFNPYEYYEKYKLEKFRDSSRLEGLNIKIPDEPVSLEKVLAKYYQG